MTHDELRVEFQSFADSTDSHIETEDAVAALTDLIERIQREGLSTADEHTTSIDSVECGPAIPNVEPARLHSERC